MSVKIARLGEEDLDRAADNCALFRKMESSPERLRQFLADDCNIFVAAEVNDRPVGQALGYILQRWDVQPPMLFLYSIDVVESYRRKGVGRHLVKRFLQIGRERGFGNAFVFTNASNKPAMSLYKELGGTRTNLDDVMFEWKYEG
jgi:ribosomal protein S18 acetylase RimI-like enzyme